MVDASEQKPGGAGRRSERRARQARAAARRSRWQLSGIAFSLPYLLVFLLGTIAPLVYSAYLGLFKNRLIGGQTFVGLQNYLQALTDGKLWSGYGRVLVYSLIQVPLMLALAVLAALMLDSGRIRHVAVPRILLFLPYAVPSVIAALMWSYLYGDRYGLVGELARLLHGQAPNFLSNRFILFAIANIVLWCYLGYNTLIYYSSLKVIPEEIYEAARIDGAGEIRIAWSLKLRHIRGSLVMTLLFSLIGGLQLFNEPSLLQVVVPDVIPSSFTPNMYSYRLAFAGQNVNYAAAVALIVGFITMGIIGLVKLIGDKWSED